VTLCQKCLAADVCEGGRRPKCPNCGARGYGAFIYECGFCGAEKLSTDWCKNAACNSPAKRLTEGAFFFLCPIRPYYRGIFSYKIALYPYTLLFTITILPLMIAVTFIGIAYAILLVCLYSKLTKRGRGKEKERDDAQRKQFPSANITQAS